MQLVHIYAEARSSAPRKAKRMTGYVLEYITHSGETVTKEAFAERDATYHASILLTVLEALGRMNRGCEVHIHTQDSYVLRMLDQNLEAWTENGFRNAKGHEVANAEQWRQVAECAAEHLLVPEPGEHSYYAWMLGEMEKAAASSKD